MRFETPDPPPPRPRRAHMRYRNGWVADSYISARNLSKFYTSGGADLVVFSELNLDRESPRATSNSR